MKPRTKAIISFFILIVLLFGLYGFTGWFSSVTGYVLGENEGVKLARCLDKGGAVFYVSSTCPKCEEQLELLGKAAGSFLEVFECESVDTCPAKEGVPAWRIDGKFYYGLMSFEELIEISGCGIE